MTVTTPLDDPGAQHLDRIIAQILAERPPVECAAIRLLCAADLADVLDRRQPTCSCGVTITDRDGWGVCDFCAARLRGEIAKERWDEFWGEVAW